MGTRILLTSILYSLTMVGARTSYIDGIILTFVPGTAVERGTNVTVKCEAIVIGEGQVTYKLLKDNILVHTETTSSRDVLYRLPDVRVSSSGRYECSIKHVGHKYIISTSDELTVTGLLSKPSLQLDKQEFNEEDDVTATCTAPRERGGHFIFYFYIGSTQISYHYINGENNQVKADLHISLTGNRTIHCNYIFKSRWLSPRKSQNSNGVNVSIKELSVFPILTISPPQEIYEGDRVNISCTTGGFHPNPESIELDLYGSTCTHGSRSWRHLSEGTSEVNHTMVVLAEHSGEFRCRLRVGTAKRSFTVTVNVTSADITPLAPAPPKAESCPSGWLERAGRCFYLSNHALNWWEARSTCQDLGGDLAVILSQDDQAFLTNLVKQLNHNEPWSAWNNEPNVWGTWIGLEDFEQEGRFTWVNGHPLKEELAFWRPWQPDNFMAVWDKMDRGQDCVAIDRRYNVINNWDDVICRASRHFLCEITARTEDCEAI